MKKLLNIILFLSIAFSCKSQTIDETIELLQAQVDALENEIIILADSNAKLLTVLDSVINRDCEDVNASHSLIRLWDTAYIYIEDSQGNYVEVNKTGGQINTTSKKGTDRIRTMWADERRVFFMDDVQTGASIIEDSLTYGVSFPDVTLQIEKRK